MKLEIKPYLNGEWKLVQYELIDVRTKSSSKENEFIFGAERVIFIGSLSECQEIKKSLV